MNIFHLHKDPITCATYHCDKHVCKMIVETTQMLCTGYQKHFGKNDSLYKESFKNHPMTLWVGETTENFQWTLLLLHGLLMEYTRRYKKKHKSTWQYNLLRHNIYMDNIKKIKGKFTKPPLCMPEKYKSNDYIKSYRDYYIGDKSYFAKWKFTETPEWYRHAG